MLGQVRSGVCGATPGPMLTQRLRGIDVAQKRRLMWLAGIDAPSPVIEKGPALLKSRTPVLATFTGPRPVDKLNNLRAAWVLSFA